MRADEYKIVAVMPNSLATRSCHNGSWLSAQEYQPHACKLHPWDALGFDRCLANRCVILVGDSLMRQMFQSLACLLAPVTLTEHASNWSSTSTTGNYLLPAVPELCFLR